MLHGARYLLWGDLRLQGRADLLAELASDEKEIDAEATSGGLNSTSVSAAAAQLAVERGQREESSGHFRIKKGRWD